MPTTQQTTDLHLLLSPDCICINLDAGTKRDLINRLVDLLDGHPSVSDLDAVREAVFAREEKMSTGVGKALGLPHAKTDAVTDTLAAFARPATPVAFDAIDDAPVQLVFLLVGPPADKSQHIKILGRISRLASRTAFRDRLLDAQTPDAVLALLREGEARLEH